MSIFDFFKKEETAVVGWFQKATPVVESAFTNANGVVNIIKAFAGSANGEALEAIFELIAPAAATAVFAALNEFFVAYGFVVSEVGKPLSQITADGLNQLAKATGNNKILAWGNVATIIGHVISTINGGNSTIQQAMVVNQLVHNPNVLGETPIPLINEPNASNTTVVNMPAPTTSPVTAQPTT